MWRKIALFLRSEPGTGASLLKMWRVDRTFFFFQVWTSSRCWPSWQKLLREKYGLLTSVNWWEWGSRWPFFNLHFFTLLHSFSLLFPLFFFSLFSFFFCTFSLFHFFQIISFFCPIFFFFPYSFSHFRWPGRGRSLAALPCLPLPYLTSLLLSSPSLTLFKKKGASRFSADFCVEKKFLPTKKADHKVYPYV